MCPPVQVYTYTVVCNLCEYACGLLYKCIHIQLSVQDVCACVNTYVIIHLFKYACSSLYKYVTMKLSLQVYLSRSVHVCECAAVCTSMIVPVCTSNYGFICTIIHVPVYTSMYKYIQVCLCQSVQVSTSIQAIF